MTTWDVVMLNNELDMLECRLREMEDRDIRHVLVESPWTHRGDRKPLYYAAHKDRFAAWQDRIAYVVAGDLPEPAAPSSTREAQRQAAWAREHAQRDAAMRVLERMARDDDIVWICDVDEYLPAQFPAPLPVLAFRQRLLMYAVDWQYPELHHCSAAARWGWLKHKSLSSVRDGRYGWPAIDGGMHLTWLGGLEGQRAKLEVTCHLEMTRAEYDRIWSGACYERGEHHGGQYQMIPVDVDESWPRWIAERKCPENWYRPRTAATGSTGG